MEKTDLEEILINFIKDQRILYNPSLCVGLPVSEINRFKTEAWEDISTEIGLPVADCQSMWLKIRNEFRKALNNRRIIVVGGKKSLILVDYKYEKQMKFLLPYMRVTSSPQEIYYPNIREHNVSSPQKKKQKLSFMNSDEVIMIDDDVDNEKRLQREKVNEDAGNSSRRDESSEEADGEIIIELDGEKLVIPSKIINEESDEVEDGGVFVKIKAMNGVYQTELGNSSIPIELELEDSGNDSEIEIPCDEFFSDLEIDEDLNLQMNPDKNSDDDKIWLVPVERNASQNNICKCTNASVDDADGEEPFYEALAITANQIDNYNERLKLRLQVSKCVMDAVDKYLESKEEDKT